MAGSPLCPICRHPIFVVALRLKGPFRCPHCAALLRVIHQGGGEISAGLIGAGVVAAFGLGWIGTLGLFAAFIVTPFLIPLLNVLVTLLVGYTLEPTRLRVGEKEPGHTE